MGCGSKLRDAEQRRSQRARRFAMTASAKVIITLCRLCHRPAATWTGLTATGEMIIPIPRACDGPMEEGCQKAPAPLQSHRWRAPLFRGRGCCQRLAGTTAPAPAVGAVSSVISSATGGSATVARPFPRLRTLWLGPLGAFHLQVTLCSIGRNWTDRQRDLALLFRASSLVNWFSHSGLLCSMPCHLCICHGANKEARRSGLVQQTCNNKDE